MKCNSEKETATQTTDSKTPCEGSSLESVPTTANASTSTDPIHTSVDASHAAVKQSKLSANANESFQSEILLFWTMPPPKEFMNRQNQVRYAQNNFLL